MFNYFCILLFYPHKYSTYRQTGRENQGLVPLTCPSSDVLGLRLVSYTYQL